MSNQVHGVPEPGVDDQCRHVVIRLTRMGVLTNKGRMILEAGDNCGDEVASAADGDYDG